MISAGCSCLPYPKLGGSKDRQSCNMQTTLPSLSGVGIGKTVKERAKHSLSMKSHEMALQESSIPTHYIRKVSFLGFCLK